MMKSLSMMSGEIVLGPCQLFCFPLFSLLPLVLIKLPSLDCSAIPHTLSSLSSLLPRELLFICQNPSQGITSVRPFSVPGSLLHFSGFFCILNISLQHTRYVIIFLLFIFVSSESSISPGTMICSKYRSGQ